MAGQKFFNIDLTTGIVEQIISTQAGGAGNENKIPSLDASGRFPQTMMPVGLGDDVNTLVASESLSAGDFINVYWNSTDGAVRVRKADAGAEGKEANGFVLSSYTALQSAAVYFEGTNNQLVGLDDGMVHFLSPTTAGASTSIVPSGSGEIVQRVGRAISDIAIAFENSAPIKLA